MRPALEARRVAEAQREAHYLAKHGRYGLYRSSDRALLAFGSDYLHLQQPARRIQPATGEWRAVVERRGR